jgi:hypothetical protein
MTKPGGPDPGHLQVEITLEDPRASQNPIHWKIHEYVCNEFNVDVDHLVGK